MKKTLLLAIALSTFMGVMSQNVCTIKGRVIDRPNSKTLFVAPEGTDIRIIDPIVVTIAEDGTFENKIDFDKNVLYEMIFKDEFQKGSMRPIGFMLIDGTIEFELYPEEDFDKNIVDGGDLNRKFNYLHRGIMNKYKEDREAFTTQLYEVLGDAAYSEEFKSCRDSLSIKDLSRDDKSKIYDRLNLLSSQGRQYNDEGNTLRKKITAIYETVETETIEAIEKTIDEASLAMLYVYVNRNGYMKDLDKNAIYKQIFNRHYAKKYADNPMTLSIKESFDAMEVVVGGTFVDFEAPDLDGKMHKLSKLIKGKVVVLDLWASWCAPCMRTSKSLIPIWEKFKDQGFEIVGVARENGNTKAMEAAIERLNLQWLNLVELNDRAKIWMKYGAGNSGGKVILIDRKGRIAAMDFTAEELEKHLEELL